MLERLVCWVADRGQRFYEQSGFLAIAGLVWALMAVFLVLVVVAAYGLTLLPR